jgi:hypothetical protein
MDPLLFKEAMVNRIFSRIGIIAPDHGLYINVLVLGYMFYNSIFRFFELVPHSRKLLAFEGTPLEEMVQGLKFGVKDMVQSYCEREAQRDAWWWYWQGNGAGRQARGEGMESSRRHWIVDVSRYDHQGSCSCAGDGGVCSDWLVVFVAHTG